MKAVLLISHGSRFTKTEEEVRQFIKVMKTKSDISIFEYAFLEIASPNIPEGIENCIQKGATDIVILLNFLNAGKHVDEDIPQIVNQAQAKHPQVTFRITPPIGQHKDITSLFLDMVKESDS